MRILLPACRFALYGSVHCTFLFPVKKLKRTCFPYKNTQLAFFAGDATTQIGLASEESGINLRARNICVDVETGVVYVRKLSLRAAFFTLQTQGN